MFQDIDFSEAWKLQNPIFIDVRSEDEYQQDHIPGAINLPILNNEERQETGTLYKQVSPQAAREYALQAVGPKLSSMVNQIESLTKNGSLIVYCWRGGQRSQAVATVLDLMRIPTKRLRGGYKSYRNLVNLNWQQPFPFPVVVLHGLTGVGKTRILKELQALEQQVIDLEGLAGNRGSAFGNIGLAPQPTQKTFESRIWYEMQQFTPDRPVIVECESKRVGRLLVPDNLFAAMRGGRHLLAYDSVPNRIEKIIEDYDPASQKEEITGAICRLKERLGKEMVASLIDFVQSGQYKPVVEALLVQYYDPLYTYPEGPSADFEYSVCAADCKQAANNIAAYLQGKATEEKLAKSCIR